MGLLDGMLGNVLGGLLGGSGGGGGGASTGAQSQPLLLTIALQLIQRAGGLQAILDRLKQAGLTKQADSWVSTGSNLPVSGEQVSQALGPGLLNQLSTSTGMDTNQLGDVLAQVLPSLVSQLTPDGQVPDNHHELVDQGLAELRPQE